MKHIFLIAIIIGLGILTKAQSEYEVSSDGTNKILKGLINRELLAGDTAFQWITTNQSGYTPNMAAVNALKAKGSGLELLVFGGTWCADTKDLLPKFFSILDAASFPEKQLTLVGVDHDKKTTTHLSEDMHITKVPTFIVLKDGKEIGRVEEYGKEGDWDKELAGIINSAN